MAKLTIEAKNMDELAGILKKFDPCGLLSLRAEIEFSEIKRAEPEAPKPAAAVATSEPVKKIRTHKPRKQKPDPFDLVENGWVLRGPYAQGSEGQYQVVRLINPKNTKERFDYVRSPNFLPDDVFKRLKKLAEPNEKNMKPHGWALKPPKKKEEKRPPPAKEPEPQKQEDGCSLCLKQKVPVGVCSSLGVPHCAECCDKLKHRVD